MVKLPQVVAERTAALPEGLVDHLRRVRKLARKLAKRHGVDRDASELGAACHDLARHMKPEDLLEEADRLEIPVHPMERRVPIMLHGPVAARWLERDGEISDPRVIEAVRYHTTGKSGMSDVSRVVFLADKLEPRKVKHRPELAEVLQLAKVDIDTALLEYVNRQIVRRVERGDLVHPRMLEFRNELIVGFPENEVVSGHDMAVEQGVR
ncbi:MAG: bis(5'-nucleosyl)-tetraphosphatase (symmetrical) YqeK [Chloroflexi bacterium]|nr:bis(5'-nucleosyl)-tetraphosphatase (symmetrical) YqeK [Chloroflexota bacterium]